MTTMQPSAPGQELVVGQQQPQQVPATQVVVVPAANGQQPMMIQGANGQMMTLVPVQQVAVAPQVQTQAQTQTQIQTQIPNANQVQMNTVVTTTTASQAQPGSMNNTGYRHEFSGYRVLFLTLVPLIILAIMTVGTLASGFNGVFAFFMFVAAAFIGITCSMMKLIFTDLGDSLKIESGPLPCFSSCSSIIRYNTITNVNEITSGCATYAQMGIGYSRYNPWKYMFVRSLCCCNANERLMQITMSVELRECIRGYNRVKFTTDDVNGLVNLFKQKGVPVGSLINDNDCC